MDDSNPPPQPPDGWYARTPTPGHLLLPEKVNSQYNTADLVAGPYTKDLNPLTGSRSSSTRRNIMSNTSYNHASLREPIVENEFEPSMDDVMDDILDDEHDQEDVQAVLDTGGPVCIKHNQNTTNPMSFSTSRYGNHPPGYNGDDDTDYTDDVSSNTTSARHAVPDQPDHTPNTANSYFSNMASRPSVITDSRPHISSTLRGQLGARGLLASSGHGRGISVSHSMVPIRHVARSDQGDRSASAYRQAGACNGRGVLVGLNTSSTVGPHPEDVQRATPFDAAQYPPSTASFTFHSASFTRTEHLSSQLNNGMTPFMNLQSAGAPPNDGVTTYHSATPLQPSLDNMIAFDQVRHLHVVKRPQAFDTGDTVESDTNPVERQNLEGYGYDHHGWEHHFHNKNSYKFPPMRSTLQDQQIIMERLNEKIKLANIKQGQLSELLQKTGGATTDNHLGHVRFESLSTLTPLLDVQRLKRDFRGQKQCDWQKYEATIVENIQDEAAESSQSGPPLENEESQSFEKYCEEAHSSWKANITSDSETTVLADACMEGAKQKDPNEDAWVPQRRFGGYIDPDAGSMKRYIERAINPFFTGRSLTEKDHSYGEDFTVDERRDCLKAVRERLQKAMATDTVPNQLRLLNDMFQCCNPSPHSRLTYSTDEYSPGLLTKCISFPLNRFPVELQRRVYRYMFPEGRSESIDLTVHPTKRRAREHTRHLPITLQICRISRALTLEYYYIVHKPVGKGIPEHKYYGKVYNKKGTDPEKLSYPRPFCYNPKLDTLCISYDFRAPKVAKQIHNEWYDKIHKILAAKGTLQYVGLKGVRYLDVRDVVVANQVDASNLSWFLPSVYGDGFLSRFGNLRELFFTSAEAFALQTWHRKFEFEEDFQFFHDKVIKYLEDAKNSHKGKMVSEGNVIVRSYVEPLGQCAARFLPKGWWDFEHEFVSKMATHIPDNENL